MAQWKKDKFPKLQAIMMAAERHSRWGIAVFSLVLAILIHLFFLLGFKILPQPEGNWEAASVLTWVEMPKPSIAPIIITKTFWNIKIKGALSKYIKITEQGFSKIDVSENTYEFKVESPKKKMQHKHDKPVIIKITIPEGEKELSIIQSSGNVDFDSAAAAFINTLPIMTNSLPEKTGYLSSIVTITCEHEKIK